MRAKDSVFGGIGTVATFMVERSMTRDGVLAQTAQLGPGSRITIKTTAVCSNDTLTTVKVRKFEIVIDEPPSNHGADMGPQPLEFLLASFAGCTNVIVHKICRDRGFCLLDMQVDVAGVLDPRGISGQEKVKVPFPEVRLTVRGKTRNTPEDMAILREELAWRCPVSVIIRESGSEVKETWEIEYL
jgi:putative redox protein